jgi:hypothetical protein
MNRTGKRNVAWTPEQSTLYATQTVDHPLRVNNG